MGGHSLLHRIFPIQESNPGLLHGRWILYQLSYQWSLRPSMDFYKYYILGWEGWEQNEHIYLHRFTTYLHKFMNQENEPIWTMQIWKWTTIKSSSNNCELGGKKVAHIVNNSSAMQETRVWSPGPDESREKGMETHCSILAWRIPRTEEPGKL